MGAIDDHSGETGKHAALMLVPQSANPDAGATSGNGTLWTDVSTGKLNYKKPDGTNETVETSGNVDLTTDVTGVLPVANGGTGGASAAAARTALSAAQAAVATGAGGTGAVTGATAAQTATNVAEARSGYAFIPAPDAASANAGACAIVTDVVVADGAQTVAAQSDVPRKLLLFITDGDSSISAGTLDLVGVGPSGEAVTESIDLTGGTASKTSTKAYATLTTATVVGLVGNDGADKIALGIASALGLVGCKTPASSTFAVHKAAVGAGAAASLANEAVGTVDATAGTIVPTTAPDGTKDFAFHYTYAVTPTQNSHTHDAGTLAGPSHTHTQS